MLLSLLLSWLRRQSMGVLVIQCLTQSPLTQRQLLMPLRISRFVRVFQLLRLTLRAHSMLQVQPMLGQTPIQILV